MAYEYCLIHREKGSSGDFTPAPYTIGWTYDECREQISKYSEIVDSYEWEIGIREVSPWCICRPVQKAEEQTLPGIEIVKES